MSDDEQQARSIRSLADLLQWHDRAFLEIAYWLILHRALDAEGARYYLRRIRAGASRIAILDQLLKSTEAEPAWDQVGDLRAAITRFRKSRKPIAGLWLRWTDAEIGTRGSLQRARAIENALGRTRQDLSAAVQTVRDDQVHLRQMMEHLNHQISTLQIGSAPPSAPPPRQGAAVPVTIVPPRARSVYEYREIDLHGVSRHVLDRLKV